MVIINTVPGDTHFSNNLLDVEIPDHDALHIPVFTKFHPQESVDIR
jgi:hypothetical protein